MVKPVRIQRKRRWIIGVPSVDEVKAHETCHPRKDGVILKYVYVHLPGKSYVLGGSPKKIATDPQSWGTWICQKNYGPFGVSPEFVRLKEIGGHVYVALGVCQWVPLADMKWSMASKFLPATDEGLPK